MEEHKQQTIPLPALLGTLTSEERQILLRFKESLGGNFDDDTLGRFLRARKFKFDKAMEMFQNYLKWREEFGVDGKRIYEHLETMAFGGVIKEPLTLWDIVNALPKKSIAQFVFQLLANNNFEYQSMQTAIKLLQALITPDRSNSPFSYFYFPGPGCGLQLNPEDFQIFPFQKAISACFWIRLEDLNLNTPSTLMLFHSQGNGGIEAYFIGNKLYYRVLGVDYSPPVEGSNGILLHEFQPEDWTFLAFEHEKPKVGKYQLRVVVNGEEVLNSPMDYPKFKSPNPILTQAAFCLSFIGQIKCIMIFDDLISVQRMKSIYQKSNGAISQGHEAIKALVRGIDKNLNKKLVLFYHPLRTNNNIAYDGVRKADAKFLGGTGVKLVNQSRMSCFGGVCALLPILEKIKNIPIKTSELLSDWFGLLITCLRDRPENQVEACIMKLFKAAPELLLQFPPNSITEEIVQQLEEISQFVMPQLRDQLTGHLLWFLDIWKKTEKNTQVKLFKLLKSLYTKAPKQLSKQVDIKMILELLICHYGGNDMMVSEEQNKEQICDIVSVIEIIFLTVGEAMAAEINNIISALFGKSSSFIQIQLLQLLKTLLSDRPGDVFGAPASVFAKNFIDASGLELLLFLISSSVSEVRTLSLALTDTILNYSTKTQIASHKEIFVYISSIVLPTPKGMSGSFKYWQHSIISPHDTFQSISSKEEESVEFITSKLPSLQISDENIKGPPMSKFKKQMKFGFLDEEEEEIKDTKETKFDEEEEDFGIKPPPAPSSKKKISFTFSDPKPIEAPREAPKKQGGFIFDEDEDAPLAPPPPKKNMKMSFDENAFSAPKKDAQINFDEEILKIPASKKEPKMNFEENVIVAPPPPKGKKPKRNLMIFEDAEEDIQLTELPMTERFIEPEVSESIDLSKTQNSSKIVKSFSQGRKMPKFLSDELIIDTEKINENYTFGGEKGEAIKPEDEGEDDPLIKEIRDMAKDCLKYMHGELAVNQEFQFYPLPPTFRPQTVRGLKTIDLSSTFKKVSENHPIIEEVSSEMSPHESLATPKRHEEDGVYHAVLGIVLKKTIEGADIIDDSDHIESKSGLTLLQEIVSRASLELKHKAMQDMLMLTKWNSSNSSILAQDADWHYWLLNLLFETPEHQDEGIAIFDLGSRIHTIVMKQAMLADEEGWKHIRRLIYWYEMKRDIEKARNIVKSLLEKLSESLQSNSMGCRPALVSTLWKNLVITSYLLEEFVIYSKSRSEEELGESLIMADEWEDAAVMDLYFQLLDPIWPVVLFSNKESKYEEEHIQLINTIEKAAQTAFKTDIQLLIFEPPGELKPRGLFIKTIMHLACMSVKASTNEEQTKLWLSIVERLIKFILLVSEAGKKQMQSQTTKVLNACILYTVGFFASYLDELREDQKTQHIQTSVTNILKYIFTVYISSLKSGQNQGFKGFLRSGFVSTTVSEDVATIILQYLSDTDMDRLESMMADNFETLDYLITTDDWKFALISAASQVNDQFDNKIRTKNICQHREKVAEKLSKEWDALSKQVEETNTRINNHVQKIANDKSSDEERKINNAIIYNEERTRQRKHMLNKRMRLLTEWRGPWHVEQEIKLEPCQLMDWQYTRPILKIRSDKFKPFMKQEQVQISENPNLLKELSPIILRKASEIEYEEDDKSMNTESEEPSARASLKPKIDSSLASILSHESFSIQSEVGIINTLTVRYGILQLITSKKEQKLRFIYDPEVRHKFQSNVELFEHSASPNKSYIKDWNVESLDVVFPKTYVMRNTAAEFFFNDGRSVLINFTNPNERHDFVSQIKKIKKNAVKNLEFFKKPNPVKFMAESGMTEKWMNWEISNFEYLMYLNYAAGRSYHDLTQYPVFPWVINDYQSPTIDLNNESIYRDLSKNMGSLGSVERAQSFKERFSSFGFPEEIPPFHFGSHYSNPGIVFHYLLRLFPYSEGARELHGGKFDLPDRLFSSISESYRLSTDDIADVRELIPEFYYLPEFLINKEDYDFGLTQQGNKINNVQLPPWANSAYDFIRINREALESDVVSERIHNWIDLIFGYKQRGDEAEKAMNIFYYMTYESNIDLDKIEDPTLRASIEAQIVHFGKTPSQLFKKPHPQRENPHKFSPGPTVISKEAKLKIYFPQYRKPFDKPFSFMNYFDLPDKAILKAKMYKDKEIFAIRRNGNLIKYSWWPTPMGECKTPFTCANNKEIQLLKDQKSWTIENQDRSAIGFNAPIEIMDQGKIIVKGGFWDGRLTVQKANVKDHPHKWCHHNTITCIDIDEEEKVGITGGKDGDVLVWQVKGDTWQPRWQYIEHDDQVMSVTICQELRLFASCSLDGTCNIYSLMKGRLIRVISLPNFSPIYMVKFSPAAPAKVVLFSSQESCLYSFSINGEPLYRVHERCVHMTSPIILRNLNQQEFLIYGTETGDIVIRYASTLEPLRRFSITGGSPVLTLMANKDLRFLLVGCADGELGVLTDPDATLLVLEKQWQLGNVLNLG
ncbi:unnamed protein product [Blepharisma stoltei]|uniref:Uncharacterized protein n=1 Tax=Blepharisma stoltei TaxID=1481888 RepID=A0AAU9K3J7_9CILI|nr:unnamed protein product [Blepharisma stoltei]